MRQGVQYRAGRWILGVATGAMLLGAAHAQDTSADELRRQQERERALREQMEQQPDVRRDTSVGPFERLPENESPCFRIDRIALEGEGARPFRWALRSANPRRDRALGKCLGTEGINVVMRRVQNAIIGRGYITTRVLAAPQDLNAGTLVLTVVPGTVAQVRAGEGVPSHMTLWNALPAKPGELLNLRDIEQGLENFKRVPTVAADIQIVPSEGEGAAPGNSDLAISWQQRRRWRAGLTLDDSGSASTGRYQAGATFSLDHVFNANDLFYVNYGRAAFNGARKGTESWTAHYDIPYDYWLLGATASAYDYQQTVAGLYENYDYSGSSGNAELKLARLLYRNAKVKFGAYARGWAKVSKNFVDDTEVEVQRKRTGGWELGLTYRQFLGNATLDAGLTYRRGTGAFGAQPSAEQVLFAHCQQHVPAQECVLEGTSRMKIITADAQVSLPFQWGRQSFRYSGSWRAQWERSPLSPADRFAIGGRYTVRGFDGGMSLSGERGFVWRNDLGVSIGGGQEFYAALDYGHISGPSGQWQLGDELVGAGLGLRGGWNGGYWDVFVGAPVRKPSGFPTAFTTTAFNLGWNF